MIIGVHLSKSRGAGGSQPGRPSVSHSDGSSQLSLMYREPPKDSGRSVVPFQRFGFAPIRAGQMRSIPSQIHYSSALIIPLCFHRRASVAPCSRAAT